MTSKEALERLNKKLLRYDENYDYYDIEIIKQDLERLEKLEKAIEILKSKTIIIFALKLSKDLNDYNRMTSFENLTQEEYELLKEVLGYGR